MNESSDTMDVLKALEKGAIDADEAVRRLSDAPQDPSHTPGVEGRRDRWLIPLSIGLATLGVGAGLATLQGWWWLCAVPLLMVGAITDLLNITVVLILLAALIAGFAFLSERVGPPPEREDAPGRREEERVHT